MKKLINKNTNHNQYNKNINNFDKSKPVIFKDKISDPSMTYSSDGTWQNKIIQPINKIVCKVPFKILLIMKKAEECMGPRRLEFGMYLKADINNKCIVVSEDVDVPRQSVTSAHIDFLDNEHVGYNGVIHRHPDNYKQFSETDARYINSNFEFSLLYVNGDITKGIYNANVPDIGRLQLDLKIEIVYDMDLNICEMWNGKVFEDAATSNFGFLDTHKEEITLQQNTPLDSFNGGILK